VDTDERNAALKKTIRVFPHPLLIIGGTLRAIGWNQELADMWNVPTGFLKKAKAPEIFEFFKKNLREGESIITPEQLEAGTKKDCKCLMIHSDGRCIEECYRAEAVDEEEKLYTFEFIDRTESVRRESQLVDDLEHYELLTESVEGLAVHAGGHILAVNGAFAQLLGYKPEEMIGTSFFELVAPESRVTVMKNIETNYEGTYEVLGLRKNGSRFWLELAGKTIFRSGQAVRVTTARDIGDQKRTEEMLFKTNSQLQAIINAFPDIYFLINKEGKFLDYYSGKEGEKFLYLPWSNVMNKKVEEVLPFEAGTSLMEVIEKVVVTNRSHLVEYSLPIAESIEFFEARLSSIFSDQVFVVVRNITARKRFEDERNGLMIKERKARITAEKLRMKAEVIATTSDLLAGTLDYTVALRSVCKLIRSVMGNWCAAIICTETKQYVLCVEAPAEKQKIGKQLELCELNALADEGVPLAIREKEAYIGTKKDAGLGCSVGGCADLVRQLGIDSYIVAPFVSHGRVMGVLFVVSSDEEKQFSDEDLQLVKQVSNRCAVSSENWQLYDSLQKALRTRDDFFAVASHELKTPLTSLIMQVQLVTSMFQATKDSQQDSGPQILMLLEMAKEQVKRIDQLVNDFLDVSRISTGRMQTSPCEVDLSKLARDVVSAYNIQLIRENQITVAVDSGLVGCLDPVRVEQVILNLLSNAVKFGEGKPIEFSCSRNGDVAVLSVKDNGPGISAENQKKLFKRFERVDGEQKTGLGLGLYITNYIVKAHGGKISVNSSEGHGSIFTVELPLGLCRTN